MQGLPPPPKHEQNATCVEELRWLYELSLAAGQSLGPQAICRSFLKALTARIDLSAAAIWWRKGLAGNCGADRLVLLDALPRAQGAPDALPLSAPLWSLHDGMRPGIFPAGTPEFASLNPDAVPTDAVCVLYPLGDAGVLLMRAADPAVLRPHRLEQLREVIANLTAAIEGGMARTKSEFLANISHEIRTPLNAMLGLARIAARENRGRRSGDTCQGILDAGEHLVGIINEILDYSKIEAGKMQVEARPFRLARVLTSVSNVLLETAREKGLEFCVDASDDLPAWVIGDAMRLQQILINLLSNAFKFTAQGAVCLKVTRRGEVIYFTVTDTGIGIDADHLQRIFRPFEQADSSTTRLFGGTGLGLTISRNLALLMGGEITVDSRPGAGSTFTLRLPLDEAPAPTYTGHGVAGATTTGDTTLRIDGLRVLAAEDVEVNRFILADLLTEAGATSVFTENGLQAVCRVEANPTAFDVVLMDVQMPAMDGYEAARRIRAWAPDLPIIGLTAHALKEERERCLASGMIDHITKPVDSAQLIEAIQRCTGWQSGAAGVPDAAVAADAVPPPSTFAPTSAGSEVDWAGLEQQYTRKRAFVGKLLQSIGATHGEFPAQLRQAAAAGDFATMAAIAHRLRSSAANIHAVPLQTDAAQVEEAARCADPAATEKALGLAARLERLLAEVASGLAAMPSHPAVVPIMEKK